MKQLDFPGKFLSDFEAQQVTEAIGKAEKITSAEIKLVIARHCWIDIRKKAVQIFKKYGLYKTMNRNCVLILIVTANRELFVCGDEGAHEEVGQEFWDKVRDLMLDKFMTEQYGVGISAGIDMIAQRLSGPFPYSKDDENEISDEVINED